MFGFCAKNIYNTNKTPCFHRFQKAFDRVWHSALWATMKKYNIRHSLIHVTEQLYTKASSAVLLNSSVEEWFQTTARVRQGCPLSPTFFNIFLERIMTDALEGYIGTVSIGGRTITKLRFADDINAIAGDEQELANIVKCLDKTFSDYGMEINAEKTKLMTNNSNGIQERILVNGKELQTIANFKYLGATLSDEGSKSEILSRIAQNSAAMARLKPMWKNNNITLKNKIRLMCALVILILLYACETWTLTAELKRRIQALEMTISPMKSER